MSFGDISNRAAVLAAVAEYDRLGEERFLKTHGYGPARKYLLVVDGKTYDSKAILGVAHGYEFPDEGALDASEFSGGAATVVRKLEALGFEIIGSEGEPSERGVKHWALCANPKYYDIERAVRELDVDWWGIGKSDLRPGDRVLIWKTKAGGVHRGVVALGEVVSEPERRSDSQNSHWQDEERARETKLRVRIRYDTLEGLPIWMDGPRGDVIKNLTVARGRGGTVFRVKPEEWETLTNELEKEAAAERGASTGQGRGLSAEERKAVEMRAMELATEHYEGRGYRVEDVSGNSPYDLICMKDGGELRVEVKGTTGEGVSVLLTANEVAHARDERTNVALYVVSKIRLDQRVDRVIADGGEVRVFEPWKIDAFDLEATQYSCKLR
jgi:hypothetical protein